MNKKDVIEYLMNTPYNTNMAVVKSLVPNGSEKFYKYVETTPYNMNRAILESLLENLENNSVGSIAVVGTAVVGTSIVGTPTANNPFPTSLPDV